MSTKLRIPTTRGRSGLLALSIIPLLWSCGTSKPVTERLGAVTEALLPNRGFMIVSDRDPTYGLNVTNVQEGRVVGLWQGCSVTSTECLWAYREGMIVSLSNPKFALKPGQNVDLGGGLMMPSIIVSANCTPEDANCTWTWTKGTYVNDMTGKKLNAWLSPHQPNPSPLVLNPDCESYNPDCTWTLKNVPITSGADPQLGVWAPTNAGEGTVTTLSSNCTSADPHCTWTFTKGMIHSDVDGSLTMNANGPLEGNPVWLTRNCTEGDPNCTWTMKADHWLHPNPGGMNILSDNTSLPKLAIDVEQGSFSGHPLVLTSAEHTGRCLTGLMGNPNCTFSLDQTSTAWSGQQSHAKWTLMIYMMAEPAFSYRAPYDMDRMKQVGSTTDVNILVLLDSPNTYNTSSTQAPLFGGRGTMLRINRNSAPTILGDLNEPNMGDPDTLSNFVMFAKTNFSADHYGLVFWDHGSGWGGLGQDSSGSPGYISIVSKHAAGDTLAAFAKGLSAINTSLGKKLDIVAFDNCLMGTWEVAAAASPYADYLLGSEDLLHGTPWGYNRFLPTLVANSSMSALDLGAAMLSAFWLEGGGTLAQVDLNDAALAALSASVSALGSALSTWALADPDSISHPRFVQIEDDRKAVLGFPIYADASVADARDLGGLARKIAANPNYPPEIVAKANDLLGKLRTVVVRKAYSQELTSYQPEGLSIYMPARCKTSDTLNTDYYTEPGAIWSSQTQWDDFLRVFSPPNSERTPPTPILTAIPADNLSVALSWSFQTQPAPGVSYSVKRATSSTGPFTTIATSVTTAGYVDNGGLMAGTTYYYAVDAVGPCATTSSTSVSAIPGNQYTDIGPSTFVPMGYRSCAGEGQTCSIGGASRYVAYGANGLYYYKTFSGPFTCGNAAFGGDPAPNAAKTCWYSAYGQLGTEGSSLTLASSTNVAYGANGYFTFKQMTGTFVCDNGTFGSDPLPGTPKACYAGPLNYSFATNESGTLNVSSQTAVAYGQDGRFVFKVLSGNAPCTNDTFGYDPAPNKGKVCYVLGKSTTAASFLADENQTFAMSGPNPTVFYGSGLNGNFIVQSTAAGTCSNTTFGADPDSGKPKHCWGTL